MMHGWQKDPLTSFSPVTFTNVEFSPPRPPNFVTFSFKLFFHTSVKFQTPT